MYTRQDYMTKKVSHAEYYGQFVTGHTKAFVANVIGLDRVKRSTDEHLNDIPLRIWDMYRVSSHMQNMLKQANETCSLSTCVCIAKVYARQTLEHKS